MVGEPEFHFTSGEYEVYDVEHLFGRDLILSWCPPEGFPQPRAIITHQRPLDFFQRRWAQRWCAATDKSDWPVASAMAQLLGEDLI